IAVFGEDPRRYCTTVKQILRDEDGKLFGLQTVRLEQKPGMQEVPGSEEEIPCDLLLIAAGFTGCRKETAEAFGAPLDVRGNLITKDHQIDTKDSRQAESGFFAAGDCRRGQSLVVWAIAEGRECARRVDEYLMGYSEM
ncbi:MAG: glutamate synthase, partial [Lachnospiraceae bacterium]|nr:glutamate synthase [Lachnospiraceae bacterium]